MSDSTSTSENPSIRVRFCPSPTGTPHVGLIRTALFNWAYARHTGGTLVLRIEDTDAARDSEESYQQLLEALRWLGIDWDEGVEVGGPHGPYRQSQRGEIYREVIEKLVAGGYLYESFSTPAEVEARHEAAGRDKKLGYDNFDRSLTPQQRAAYVAEGREPVWRMRLPDTDTTVEDLIRGPVTFPAGSVPDFVVVRADGSPLYALVNAIDDALMGITHVLRGEDLLPSTPRQLAIWTALVELGIASRTPLFGHLPYVMGEGNRKLSKRDPQSNLFHHRDRGFIPEGLLNYLALLGWSIAEDRDVFSMAEMVAAFDIADVNANPARFDEKKAEAINAEHVRLLPPEVFRDRLVPYLQAADVLPDSPSSEQFAVLDAAAPLVQTRMQLLGEAPGLLGFLFRAAVEPEEDALAQVSKDAAQSVAVLDAALAVLGSGEWTAPALEERLRAALVDGLGIKPKFAFGPLRVAVSGRRVSPPLFESMEILGLEVSRTRLEALRGRLAADLG
ncbi:glutamate--tRNA ligase [Spongisporangium articulatum]|uniref:Glutamate--tRNA ligase n=1 Tax=Spongisporangium articulatum TaxID=3362603 RepID=A0ABW8AN37_9ACTN